MPASVPLPPASLAVRVGVNDPGSPLESFDELGAVGRQVILDALPDGWTFAGRRVLDFGCGSGKVLRHFVAEARDARIEGCDIHAASVEWVQRHLGPAISAFVNAERPPLARPDGAYDLVWAMSVFTHLAESALDWLLELHRVLAPDGLLVASVLGRAMWEKLEPTPWDESRIGLTVVDHGRPWDAGGPFVYLSRWWLEEHWGRLFDILGVRDGVAPGEHTIVVLRRRPVSLSRADLERFDSVDEREVAAQRFQIELLRRDIDRLRAAHSEALAGYEDSLSWRVTEPLRRGAAAVRALRAERARR